MCQSFADKWHHSYTPTRTAHAFATHPSKEAPTPIEHAIVLSFLWGWSRGPLSGLMYGPPMQDPHYGHLHQSTSLKRLAMHHTVVCMNVIKNSITSCSVWAHQTVTVQCIYVLGNQGCPGEIYAYWCIHIDGTVMFISGHHLQEDFWLLFEYHRPSLSPVCL